MHAMANRGICYYETLPEKETLRPDRNLDTLKSVLIGLSSHNMLLGDNVKAHHRVSAFNRIEQNKTKRYFQLPHSPL